MVKLKETTLKGSYLIDLEMRADDRGFFARYYCERDFASLGLNASWPQLNNSLSKNIGTLRGLHYQMEPYAEVKMVRCIQGAIWDAIVDLREESETFGKWYGAELSAENRTVMYVPKGFAHGFISLKPESEILYMVSEFYTPEAEKTLLWSDQRLAIEWPIKPELISEKDQKGQTLDELFPLCFGRELCVEKS